jgi:hypothetical protein
MEEAKGTITRPEVTTYMYGTHALVEAGSKRTSYALSSKTIDLDRYVGRYVHVSGSQVPGYPVDGGPPYLEVFKVDYKGAEIHAASRESIGSDADVGPEGNFNAI